MNQATQLWLLSGAVAVLGSIIAFATKLITQQVIKRLDSIIDELQSLTKITVTQEVNIRSLQDHVSIHNSLIQEHAIELSDHSHRIMKLEVKLENK